MYRMGNFIFCTGMSVCVTPCPNIVIFPIKRNDYISVVYHISYGNEGVVNFHSVHCRTMEKLSSRQLS